MKFIPSLLSSLLMVGCSHIKAPERFPSSADVDSPVGIIKQVECNRTSGLGAIELQSRNGDTLESTWYKVSSFDLCSKDVRGHLQGSATALTEMAFKNNLSRNAQMSKLIIKEGVVIDVHQAHKVDYAQYTKKIKAFESIGQKEVLDWYFQNRRGN
jgi:hypothetical protein